MSEHHETPREAEPVPGAGDGALVGEVLGNFLESAPHHPVEWLQAHDGFANAVEQLPCGVASGDVGDLVREETCLVFDGEFADPFGTTDLRLSDAGGKWNGDRL